MTCKRIPNGIVCGNFDPANKFVLEDGRIVYMEWHNFMGPMFFKDADCTEDIIEWYDDPMICAKLDEYMKERQYESP